MVTVAPSGREFGGADSDAPGEIPPVPSVSPLAARYTAVAATLVNAPDGADAGGAAIPGLTAMPIGELPAGIAVPRVLVATVMGVTLPFPNAVAYTVFPSGADE